MDKKSPYWDILSSISSIIAVACALIGSMYVAVLSMIVAAFFYLCSKKKKKANSYMQLYSFLRLLSRSYKRRSNMLTSLEDSLFGVSEIERNFIDALNKYKSGDTNAFLSMKEKMQNTYASELVVLIWKALHSGEDVYVELCGLKYSVGNQVNAYLKRVGQVSNTRFVSLMGIVLFFPLFAGISIAILSYAPQLGSQGRVSITSITFVFAAYLAIELFVHFKDDVSTSILRKVSSVAVCSSFGLLLLKVGSLFAMNAI